MSGALGLLLTISVAKILSKYMFAFIRQMLPGYLQKAAEIQTLTMTSCLRLISGVMLQCLVLALPLLIAAGFSGFLMGGAQTKFLFAPSLLAFKFSRINPIEGFKRLFSMRSFVELVKSFLKVVIISLVLYTEIKSLIPGAEKLIQMQLLESLLWIMDAVYTILIKICVIMIAIGIFDFLYQWWDYERQLRMTKQEVKDEYKTTEGDPLIKGRIRQIQNSIRRARMMQRVPQADVVVRNPTHYAVAIKYEAQKNRAPTVIAKGRDLIALKIVEVAEQNNVTVMENRPLARGLYESVELDREIPPQYYQAVAEVLAFVYSLKRRKRGL